MTPHELLKRLPLAATAGIGLACLGAITLGFIMICLTMLLQARHDAAAAADIQAHNIAASVAQDVARNIDLYDLSLQAVVRGLQSPGVLSLDPTLRQMILFGRAAHAPYFGFINALDASGTVIADSQSITPRGGNFAGRDYFVAQRQDARDRLFIGRPFLTGDAAMIPLSRRLSNPDGSFAGVVVGSIRLAYFRDLLARLQFGPHGIIVLLRSDGMVLTGLPFDADAIGRRLPPDAAFYRAPEGGTVASVDAADHLRRRFLFQRIGTLPLMVGVGLADADIYAAWRSRVVTLGLAIAALSGIEFLLLLMVRATVAALQAGDVQRAALLAQREQGVEEKARFAAAVSHQLRTPLNSVLGYAELMAMDGGLAVAQADRLSALRSAGEHLRGVIDRVLDFSRAESGETRSVPVPTDWQALVAECCAMTQAAAAAKRLRLTWDVAPSLPQHIMVDAGALRQALLELLGNAVKFTEHGEIVLRGATCAAGLRLAVIDRGIGVASDQRDRLFRPYDRLNADQLGVAGTGLGLAIVASLAARMGGTAGYEPNPAGGSIVWLELPLRPTDAPVAPAPVAASPQARVLRALVVDDSAMNRDVIAGFLLHAGHRVVQADSGKHALQCAAAEDFDVILMDLHMPGMDGADALRRIRALPGGRGRTPAIAVTAQVMEDGGEALLAGGFQALLIKPIDHRSLLTSIAAAVGAQGVPGSCAAEVPAEFVAPGCDAIGWDPDDGMTADHRAEFSRQIARLLHLLQAPAASSELPEVVHRIAGDAAQLGYAGLTMAARRYEASCRAGETPPPEAAAMLRDTAETALEGLGRQRGDRG